MLVGSAVGLTVALVLWVFLFAQFVDVAPPRYPIFDAAKPVAIEAGGRYRWPGTTVRVHEVGDGIIDVERRWLGLSESVIRVQRTQAGWDVASPVAGPAHALQAILACVLPGAAAGWLVARTLSRRSRSRSGPTPEQVPSGR